MNRPSDAPWRCAFVGLGSNLGDSRAQIERAMLALANLPSSRLLKRSRLYRTAPWGVLNQPDFVNAAVLMETMLTPHALLDALLVIERDAGRVRGAERWGPRILDLDLLHVEGLRYADERLTLPHPRMAERAFVLMPLHDLAPQLELPDLGRVDALLAQVDVAGCQALA